MGRPLVGARKQSVNLSLDPRQLKAVDRAAKKAEKSRSEVVREALALWLEKQVET